MFLLSESLLNDYSQLLNAIHFIADRNETTL